MQDPFQSILAGGELVLNQLTGTETSASHSPASSAPALSGSAQPQSPANGQGAGLPATPFNYQPYIFGGVIAFAVLVGVVLMARK